MTNARYSVIRYIPDPGRGESLNAGILVWSDREFELGLEPKAVERIIRENPRLERDALLYVEPMLREMLSSAHGPPDIEAILESQRGYPLDITESRLTTIGEGGISATLARLQKRIVQPQRRGGGRPSALEQVARALAKPLASGRVTRRYPFASTRSGIPRSADFFANSGANVALDVVRLALKRGDEIRLRSDAQAFKVQDVLEAENGVCQYVVFCEFADDPGLEETSRSARRVIEGQGASIVTTPDEATKLLERT